MKRNEQKLTSKEILNRGYVRRLAPDVSGGYVASILEFPGCYAEGDTADEALENLDKAAESWIDVALANNQHVREPIDFDGYSGKFALRMPRMLHKQVAELAELEGVSLNQLLVAAIAHYVSGRQLLSKLESLVRPLPSNFHFDNVNIFFRVDTSQQKIPRIENLHFYKEAITIPQEKMILERTHG